MRIRKRVFKFLGQTVAEVGVLDKMTLTERIEDKMKRGKRMLTYLTGLCG